MGFSFGIKGLGNLIANPGEAYGTNSAIGNALNSVTGVNSSMDRSYQQQKEAAAQQNAYNREMWNLQNEYNSPSAQLARMRDAGIDINPTSYALGTGNLSNTAVHVGAESGFAGSGSPAGNPISMLLGMAQGLQGVRESKTRASENQAQIRNLGVQHGNLITQGEILSNQAEASRIQNEIARHNLQYGRKIGKPVGYVPTVYSDPVNYAGGILGDYLVGMFK